eukprot:2630448-Ditylum_brightwellii.AAC.1
MTLKGGEENYELACKFDLIWDVLTHNTNVITKHAYLDVVGDETCWGHQGFGEPASGLVKNLQQARRFNEGPNEVKILMEKLDDMTMRESTNKNVKMIFKEKPT